MVSLKRQRSSRSANFASTSKRRKSAGVYRKRRGYRPRLSLTKAVVPDFKLVKLRYVALVNINPSAGVGTNNIFWANGLYKPNYTGALDTVQPMGYNQWSEFYNHYVVIGSKISATFTSPSSTSAVGNGIIGICLRDNTTGIGSVRDYISNSNSKYRVMSTKDGSRAVQTIRKGFSAKKFFGITDIKDNRDQLGALVNANPSDGAFFHVFVGALGAGDDVGGTDVMVTIDFLVCFSERKQLLESVP